MKLVDDPENDVWNIRLTSVLFSSGDGPNGIIVTEYGGLPLPAMLMSRFSHCCGMLVKLKVYADAKAGSRARYSGIMSELPFAVSLLVVEMLAAQKPATM